MKKLWQFPLRHFDLFSTLLCHGKVTNRKLYSFLVAGSRKSIQFKYYRYNHWRSHGSQRVKNKNIK